MFVYTRDSIWNPNLSSQETDRPLRDRPAACVIAQQYSSTTFSHYPGIPTRKKFGERLKLLLDSLSLIIMEADGVGECLYAST